MHELVNDIDEIEKEDASLNTLIIGDFNTSPFAPEMVNKKALNAVLFKELIEKQEIVTYDRRQYRRFYNPMLLFLSERDKVYGSHYYSSGIDTINWYAYDQFCVRKTLVDKVKTFNYCKSAGNICLVTKNNLPNKKYSDHLPLLVEVEI